jgi:phosphatidylglycerol lysyltransferase
MSMHPKILRWLGPATSVMLLGAALWVLNRALRKIALADVLAEIEAMPLDTILAASVVSWASYVSLIGFDVLALRYVKQRLPLWRMALAAFVSQGISHSLGFALITGGAIRLRMYTTAGIGALDVARILAIVGMAFTLGAVVVAAVASLLEPARVAAVTHSSQSVVLAAGSILLALYFIYLYWCVFDRRPLSFKGQSMAAPTIGITLMQTVNGAIDLALAGAALYLLLPAHNEFNYPAFLGVYVIAYCAGIISHVPGGLGVFEGVVVLLMPEIPVDQVIGAVLVYRVIYNLWPLAFAAGLLGGYEIINRPTRA